MEKLEVPSNQLQGSESAAANPATAATTTTAAAQQDRIDQANLDDDHQHYIASSPANSQKEEQAQKTPSKDAGQTSVSLEQHHDPAKQIAVSPQLLLPSLSPPNTNTSNQGLLASHANAVRVLFKDHQDKEQELPPHDLEQQQVIQVDYDQGVAAAAAAPTQQTTNTTNTSIRTTTGSGFLRPVNRVAPQVQATIVSANRRLIERQIEAIQEADSRRWNFNFRACRPLGLADHRYQHLSPLEPSNTNRRNVVTSNDNNNNNNDTVTNCRPLGDQNANRLTNNNHQRYQQQQQQQRQQRWWSTRATRGNLHPTNRNSDSNKPEDE